MTEKTTVELPAREEFAPFIEHIAGQWSRSSKHLGKDHARTLVNRTLDEVYDDVKTVNIFYPPISKSDRGFVVTAPASTDTIPEDLFELAKAIVKALNEGSDMPISQFDNVLYKKGENDGEPGGMEESRRVRVNALLGLTFIATNARRMMTSLKDRQSKLTDEEKEAFGEDGIVAVDYDNAFDALLAHPGLVFYILNNVHAAQEKSEDKPRSPEANVVVLTPHSGKKRVKGVVYPSIPREYKTIIADDGVRFVGISRDFETGAVIEETVLARGRVVDDE